ncbi:MAG: IPT/TIG domain-containing protein, partial [Frankiales bacterium]|nr:IPT/TIG domain-containing protein [Frankiales bacterium]
MASALLVILSTLVGVASVTAPASAATACNSVTNGPSRVGNAGGLVHPLRTGSSTCGNTARGADLPTGAAGPYGGNPPLINHGGPVMSTPTVGDQVIVTPIYWVPSGYSFTASYQNVINTYLSDLATDSSHTTNVFASMYQYSGSNGAISYRMTRGTPITDTSAYPAAGCTTDTQTGVYGDNSGYSTCLDQAQIATEVNNIINANGLTRDLGHLYPIFLPKGVETCFAAGYPSNQGCSINANPNQNSSAFCAYHSYFTVGAQVGVYANMPFPVYNSSTGYSCTAESLGGTHTIQQPNSDPDADVETSPLSHEMAEAITDPQLNAWYDASGNENGDDCAYIYGGLSGSNGGFYNQTVNGHHYLTQEEFSNADYVPATSGCIQSIQPVVPTVTSLSSASGPTAGGGSITINGTGFPGATAVHFGSATATFTIVDASKITATVPAGSLGTTDVTVTTGAGTSSTGASDHYTYADQPTVTNVSPSSGAQAGGTSVTITGTNFLSGATVSFGANAGTGVTVNSATSITATSPAGTGTVDVRVTTVGGTSATGAADHFTYSAGPSVSSVSPSAGPTAGGTVVTITGTNFVNGATVSFGGSAGTGVIVNSATSITATSPAGSGTVHVTVTTPGGTSATSGADQFTYDGVPSVTGVSPSAGPTAGGTVVTITGSNFVNGATVSFGGSAGTGVIVNSGTSITATSPAGSGTVDVTVTTPGGTSATSNGDQFTYDAQPAVSGVSPNAGPTAGGTVVTITGSNFTADATVKFGGTLSGSVAFNSSTQLTATAPAGSGTVHVTVSNPGGTSGTSSADQFTYNGVPTVTGVSPSAGPTAGGTVVTITGTNFVNGATVSFGGSPGTSVIVNSATCLSAPSPAGSGTVHVTVTTPGGTSATSGADQFTYDALPTVTGVSPNAGPTAGGTVVTITGTNFLNGATVSFGGSPGTSVTVNSGTSITATSPAGSGTVHVTVTTPGGTSATSGADQFTYDVLPTVTGVSPSAGPTAGGTPVTITGTGFVNGATVSFGGSAATGVTVNSATSISATSPAGSGTVHVRVTTPGGTSATSGSDQFTYDGVPSVTGVSPSAGPTAGGTVVTITGSNFVNGATVSFGGSAGTSVTVNSGTSITATSPSGTGTVHVTVSSPGGTSTTSSSDQFTYDALPVVTGISPSAGPTAGGTVVTITGSNFTADATVKFGSVTSGSVAFNS